MLRRRDTPDRRSAVTFGLFLLGLLVVGTLVALVVPGWPAYICEVIVATIVLMLIVAAACRQITRY